MRTPRSLLRRVVAVIVTATIASTLVAAPASATGTLDVHLTVSGTASCSRTLGQWFVTWRFHTESLAMHHTENARDPVNGVSANGSYDFNQDREADVYLRLPGSATTAAVTAEVTREGQAGSAEYTRSMPLGEPCVQDNTTPPACASHDDMRYRHTFNAATGYATVEVVDKPLCDGLAEFLMLAADAPNSGYTHDLAYTTIGPTTARVVTQVGLPTCAHTVSFEFMVSGADNTLGSTTGPGSRSTGPYARVTGGTGTCTAQPSLAIEPFRVTVGDAQWLCGAAVFDV